MRFRFDGICPCYDLRGRETIAAFLDAIEVSEAAGGWADTRPNPEIRFYRGDEVVDDLGMIIGNQLPKPAVEGGKLRPYSLRHYDDWDEDMELSRESQAKLDDWFASHSIPGRCSDYWWGNTDEAPDDAPTEPPPPCP